MPKGVYSRDGEFRGAWSDEQDEWLKAACQTGDSYGAIAKAFNRAFPLDPKTRSAIIGRAARRGYTNNKPRGKSVTVIGAPKPSYVDKRIKGTGVRPVDKVLRARKKHAVQFDDGLREETDPGTYRRSHPHMARKSAPAIEEARKGQLPSIIEAAPLTSKPFFESAHNECKWPTSNDVRDLSVCGAPATHGAYCRRHAEVAYQTMPTRKRNGSYSRRGFEEERKRISDADAQWIADHVLDDEVTIAPVEHTLLEFTPGTGRPFNGNK